MRYSLEIFFSLKEVLFSIFDSQPELAIKVLKENNELNVELILEELSIPIHDGINVQTVKDKIVNRVPNSKLKDKILSSLKVAIDRHD